MAEKRFRFIPVNCICLERPTVCPVEKGAEFTARIDGGDEYKAYQSLEGNHPSAGMWFAACPVCHSHKSVEEV